jgi:AcrR family transcriptional regulator
MARGRIKGDHEAKRVQIAEAACKVFLRLGLPRTSLADIAREMGYTTGVLRHYFADKDELLLFVKNLLFDRMHLRAASIAEHLKGIERLRAMATELLPFDLASIASYRLLAMFNGNAIGDPRLMKIQHKRNDRHILSLAQVIAGLQDEGVLPKRLDPRVEAAGILALIDGLGEQQIMRPEAWPREPMQALVRRYIDSMAQSGASTRR